MCGRYGLSLPVDELSALFDDATVPSEYVPRYNIAPGQDGLVALSSPGGNRPTSPQFRWGRWGFRVAESPEAKAPRPINARSETVATRAAFRDAFRSGRCLIPASGFFEWRRGPAARIPYWIRGETPLMFAGVCTASADGAISYAVLTRPSPPEIQHIHDRAPVLIKREDSGAWLDRSAKRRQLEELMRGPSPSLHAHPVSTRVNHVDQDDPDLLKVEPEPLELPLE